MIQRPIEISGFDNSLKHTGGTDRVRVVLHLRGTTPDPLNQGVDIPTGSSVVLGITSQEIERLQKPYGNCTSHNYEEMTLLVLLTKNKSLNKVTSKEKMDFSKWKYSTSACKGFCYQKHNWMNCGCLDATLPTPLVYRNKTLFCSSLDFGGDLKISDCCMENIKDKRCFDTIHRVVSKKMCLTNVMAKDKHSPCPPPCHELHYDTSYSVSTWLAKGPQLVYAYHAIVEEITSPYLIKKKQYRV